MKTKARMHNENYGNGSTTSKYARNNTPMYSTKSLKPDTTMGKQGPMLHQSMMDPDRDEPISSYRHKQRGKIQSKTKYAQRKESVTSKSSNTSHTSYLEKSKIPLPKAVKKLSKPGDKVPKKG